MEQEIHVYMDINGESIFIGRLWVREKGGRETSTFTYDRSWVARLAAFDLSPSLPRRLGAFHSSDGLFNAFDDSSPDKWGKKLMRHHERERASRSGTQPRTLSSIDFLAGVDDQTRLGALRFKRPDGDIFLSSTGKAVPPLIELKTLLSASERIEKGRPKHGDLELILGPGGSLGGARPKAGIRDKDGALHIAKFPWREDEWPVILWEHATLGLAKAAGINVPDFRLEYVGTKPVLLVGRFDRVKVDVRVAYMSAMTALDGRDHEDGRSYLELVDFIRRFGSTPDQSIRQLWKRVVFNILVSNIDDHMRNHGFLHAVAGWDLSPAFDMNPYPLGKRIHKLAINEEDHTASLDLVLSVAAYFGLKQTEAKAIANQIGIVVSGWKKQAAASKLTKEDIEFMRPAFEHGDLKDALSLSRDKSLAVVKKKPSNKQRRQSKGSYPAVKRAGNGAAANSR